MKSWIIYLLGLESPTTNLSVGSRVNTPSGPGEITAGALYVKLDKQRPGGSSPNDKTVTVKIDNITAEK